MAWRCSSRARQRSQSIGIITTRLGVLAQGNPFDCLSLGWRLPSGRTLDDLEMPSEIKSALMCTLQLLDEKHVQKNKNVPSFSEFR